MQDALTNPQQSLDIIQNMIRRAQNDLSENGFLFIFWGWLVFLTAAAFYFLIAIGYENPGYAWLTTFAGGIFTAIYSARQKKKEKVRTYIDHYMTYVWTSFFICLVLVLGMGFKLQLNCYPMVIMLYATATFVTGGIIRFRPLVVCGLLSYPIAAFAFFVAFEQQILLLALSILVSYIVPGHWLQFQFKKQQAHGA